MTMRERFCEDGPDEPEGLMAVLGEPTVLAVECEGEARTSLGAPPPLLDCAPAPCEAAAAAEEASCEAGWGAIVLARADSSWLAESCCPAGGKGAKGDEADEASDDLRLPTEREGAGGSAESGVVVGAGVVRGSGETAVETGVGRVLGRWWWFEAPQGIFWLIEMATAGP